MEVFHGESRSQNRGAQGRSSDLICVPLNEPFNLVVPSVKSQDGDNTAYFTEVLTVQKSTIKESSAQD